MRQKLPLTTGTSTDTEKGMGQTGIALVNGWIDRQGTICRFPGFAAEYDLGTSAPVDGLYESKVLGIVVAASAGRLFRLYRDGSFKEVEGASLTAGVPVSFAEDTDSILFAAKSQLHRYDGARLTIIGNSPTGITFVGYTRGFVLTNGDGVPGDSFYTDDKAGGYARWEVYNNESRADALMTMMIAFEQVFTIGTDTTEIVYLSGDPANPFTVNVGGTIPYGATGRHSAAFDGNSVYFLGNLQGNRKLVRLAGGREQQIISFPLDFLLADMEDTSGARAFVMTFRGQQFYVVNFPNANVELHDQIWPEITLAYDIQRDYWIILGQWDAEAAEYRPYRVASFLRSETWGKSLCGGRDGRIFSLEFPEADDYTQEPVLLHRWRNDGKRQWQTPRILSLGHVGDYPKFLRSNACGTYYSRQHEFIFSDRSEAGEPFRLAVVTGNIDYKTARGKRSAAYIYTVQRGTLGFALGSVEEELQVLSQ